MFPQVQIEFAMLRGRYEELSISQRELEKMTADEQAMRMAAETRLTSSEGTIDSLREENRALRMKLDSTTQRMTQCDESLAQASEQLATLSKEVAGIADTRDSLATAQAEVGILKGDIARLMRLLEHYPSAKGFLQKWRDGESMSFMGIPGVGASSLEEETHGGSDLPRAFNEAEYQKEKLISPEEVDQLKRLHGIDTFPVQKTFQQESEYWVPREAAHIGMSFMVSKIPHAPPGMIYEFLRNLSKVWLKREKRKLGRIRDMYEKKLSDMRRRIENAKPYKGVMAGQQIKRLKSQVKEKTLQKLSGHPKPRPDTYDAEYEDYLTFEEPDTEIRKRGPHEMRISDQIRKAGEDAIVRRSVEDVSAEKLLEASLISLETIGRQRATDKKSENLALGSGYGEGPFPSESYLKGALWIGRNLTLVIEELADSLDIYRNKHLVEVAGAVQDSDPRRSSHRLNLLAAAGITECLSLANTSRMRARNILQGAASILPGDNHALKGFVSTLPIESAVGKATDQAREPLSPRQLRRSRAWEESPHHSSMTH
jgi:hypothetical protein